MHHCRYKLHSVLVHSGGVHGGHYFSFTCVDGKQWLKFDDEKVGTSVSKIPFLLCNGLESGRNSTVLLRHYYDWAADRQCWHFEMDVMGP